MTTETPTPKKTKFIQYFFIGVATIFGLLGIDHYTTNWASGGATIAVTDSTIVVSQMKDSVIVKKDSVKAKKDTVISKIK